MPTDVKKFELECLQAHNKFRAQHGCPPLQLNRTLSARSREWAKNLAMRKTIENSSGHNFGENLYMAEGIHVDGARPVKAWYDEIEDYDFEAAHFVQGTGHFTQLIWKSTRDLGVGVATNDNVTVVVTNYFTPGNIHGQFRENVPPRIDRQENIHSSFSEGSSSVASNIFGGTLNIVLPNNFKSSTIISQGRDSSIPIGMVSAATSPRFSKITDISISSAQLVMQSSSDTFAGTDTRNSTTRESRNLNRTMRNSISIKDIRYMPPPNIEAPNKERQTSSSGRVLLYRTNSNITVDDKEPRTRHPSRRQEAIKMMPAPKIPGVESIVLKNTSSDEFANEEQPSVLYKTFSNIVIKNQEQTIPHPFTTTIRSDVTRPDSISINQRGMVPSTVPVKQEPRSSSDNGRNILYKTISNIVLEKQDQIIPHPYTAPIRPGLTRQKSISEKRGDKSFVTAPRTEAASQEQNREIATTTTLRTQAAKQGQTPTKTNEADKQQQSSTNNRNILYKTTSTIFLEDQEPRSRQQLRRQDSIPQSERDISIENEIARQEQNKKMKPTTTSNTQTPMKTPGSSKVPDMVQKTPSAHEAERQQRTSANVGRERPSTRHQLRRQDSISQSQRDMSHKFEISREEQSRETAPITNPLTDTSRKVPGPAKVPAMLRKTASAHEVERQLQASSANDRKFLHRTVSDIVVGRQEPSTRQPFRRQDSISANEREMAYKAETSRQEQNKEMVAEKSFKTQTTSKEPGPSKVPDSEHKTISTHESQRQQRTSTNDKKSLYRTASDIVVGTQGPSTLPTYRSQDFLSPMQRDMALKTERTTSRAQISQAKPGPSKVPDIVEKSSPVHETQRQQANDKKFLYRTASDIVVGTQGPSTLQPFRSQDFLSPKERDMAFKTETTHRAQIFQAMPGPSKGPDIVEKSTPAHETTSSNGKKLQGSQEQTTQQQQSNYTKAEDIPKADIAKGIEAIRKEFARQVQNKEIPPKTTLSIQTAQSCSNCNKSKSSKNADIAHAMALRTKIANQEHNREMATKPNPTAESCRQIPRSDTTDSQQPETTKNRNTTIRAIKTDRQNSRAGGSRPGIVTPSVERLKNTYEFSKADKQFHHECLLAHNCYRAKHCSPPLQLCDLLSIYATKWAQELACMNQLLYSPTQDLGENIYMAAGIRINGDTPVKAWYNEIEDYDFERAQFTPYTGHFTQVIWKDTRELGVGVIKTENCCIVVASYYPPGNEVGQFEENVLPPSLGCTWDTAQSNNNRSSNNSDNIVIVKTGKDLALPSSNNIIRINSSDSLSNSSKTSSGHGFLKAGIVAAALAAAVGGWMIYHKPSP